MRRTFILKEERYAAALYAFLKANWRAMADDGKPLAVEVREHKDKRSVEANKYYWQLLKFIAGNAWIGGKQYSDEAWHEMFKGEFLGYEDLPNGKKSPISSTKLNVAEFAEYLRSVEQYAAVELGLELPANPRDLM